jgi:hypothetical protein
MQPPTDGAVPCRALPCPALPSMRSRSPQQPTPTPNVAVGASQQTQIPQARPLPIGQFAHWPSRPLPAARRPTSPFAADEMTHASIVPFHFNRVNHLYEGGRMRHLYEGDRV